MPELRKYDPELMRRAVELVERSNRPVAHVAAELGIGLESLRKCSPRRPSPGSGLIYRRRRSSARSASSAERSEERPRTNEVLRPGDTPAAAGVSPAVLVDAEHPHPVETAGVLDQQLPAGGEDGVVDGVPRGAERGRDPRSTAGR